MDREENEIQQGNTHDSNTEPKKDKKSEGNGNYMVLGMCLGVALGMFYGQLVFNNMAIGMCLGASFGMSIGMIFKKK